MSNIDQFWMFYIVAPFFILTGAYLAVRAHERSLRKGRHHPAE